VSEVTTLGLVLHPTKPVDDSVQAIISWAGPHGVTVIARSVDRQRVTPAVSCVDDRVFVETVDGIVSLGGDGTMLGAMRLVWKRPVPVLGVNHGNLGFLIEISPDELSDALAELVGDSYSIQPYGMIRVSRSHETGAETDAEVAFNDVVLAGLAQGAAVTVDLSVGGAPYGYYRCDALVVSTPAGSTAYNYAAGGPIVSPMASTMVITPVAPMSGISRALVLSVDDIVSLQVPQDSGGAQLRLDGVPGRPVTGAAALDLTYVPEAGQVVRLDSALHVRRSNVKLSLLDLPMRPDELLKIAPPDLRKRLRAGHAEEQTGDEH
jgi:NAD+ kinase